MHQIQFQGAHSAPPDPLAVFGEKGKERKVGERWKKREGAGESKGEGAEGGEE